MTIKKQNLALIIILFFSFLVRFWRLDYPSRFMFDEVYHAFTAQAYAKNDPRGYEWWNPSPVEGTAYEWLHPPTSKLLMAAGIILFGDNSFGWRVASASFGVLAVLLLYMVGRQLFKNELIALFSTLLFALDGLPLVQSRIAMNDIFITTFILLTVYFLIKFLQVKGQSKKYLLLTGLFAGLAISTKWTGAFVFLIIGGGFLLQGQKWLKQQLFKPKNLMRLVLALIVIPLLVYLLSYGQFWLQGHTWDQFVMLHKQIWWYQTGLKATHPFQSSALSWPLIKRPVWFFVDYGKEKIANIYAMGNPLTWWGGLLALPFAIWQAIRKRNKKLGLIVLAYLALFLPWAFSPRIMFIYHYLPSVPFLCLMLGWALGEFWDEKLEIGNWKLEIKRLAIGYLALTLLMFIFFYPHWTGIHVPKRLDNFYYWFSSWK